MSAWLWDFSFPHVLIKIIIILTELRAIVSILFALKKKKKICKWIPAQWAKMDAVWPSPSAEGRTLLSHWCRQLQRKELPIKRYVRRNYTKNRTFDFQEMELKHSVPLGQSETPFSVVGDGWIIQDCSRHADISGHPSQKPASSTP